MRFIILFVLGTVLISCQMESKATFQSERIRQSSSFIVHQPIQAVFPLFGPIREKEWAFGWDPKIIYGKSDVEQHMIFTTAGHEGTYTWAVTKFDPENYIVEYTVSTMDRIWFIEVQCEDQKENTRVTVTYTYTGLTAQGNELNKKAFEKMFAHDLRDWEEAINHYLSTGQQLHP